MKKYFPGLASAFLIALVAVALAHQIPIIGGSILSLTIGILISSSLESKTHLRAGLNFSSKKLLKLAIIFLGTGLSINKVLEVGKYSLFIMLFTLSTAFFTAYIFSDLLKINWKLSNLIAIGTGVCGGSAIATLSPIIEADENDIAYALSATFIFDILMILLFPLMGNLLGLSDLSYGLWTGTAVNDTSSVVAAGYAFSEQAGDFATIVKLTRTTSIIPIALIFSLIIGYKKAKTKPTTTNQSPNIKSLFPWFILLFIFSSILNTTGLIPPAMQGLLKTTSKFMMAMALGAIGLKSNLDEIFKSGMGPMFLGFIVSLSVVVVSILVQFLTGQI
ncbi:MAG: putative sulfate exporter family transporter [Halanaerobacter sp.]